MRISVERLMNNAKGMLEPLSGSGCLTPENFCFINAKEAYEDLTKGDQEERNHTLKRLLCLERHQKARFQGHI